MIIKVKFKANCGGNQYVDTRVQIGDPFPEIEIINLNTPEGTHQFSIERIIPNASYGSIKSIIAECSVQIEYFLTITSHIRGGYINILPDTTYEIDGQEHKTILYGSSNITANLVGLASPDWFKSNHAEYHKLYNYDLLKRLKYALELSGPISKYVSLYSLLLSIYADDQNKLDDAITSIDKNVLKTPSPHRTGVYETIYTRLRNELAHYRHGTSIINTHEEIIQHIDRFSWIVKELINPLIISK